MEIISGKHAVLEVLRAKKRKCFEIQIAGRHVIPSEAPYRTVQGEARNPKGFLKGSKEKIVVDIEDAAKKSQIPVKFVSPEEISAISSIEKHQGVAAKCDPFPFSYLSDVLKIIDQKNEKGFLIVLDGILDPQNLGALIRTAHLCGVHGIILPKDNSASISPAVVKTSSGATEYMPIVQVTNIVATLKELKDKRFWVVGAAGDTDQNIYLFDFTKDNCVLVLGAEGKGIKRLVKENCDFLLKIPMVGKIGSYNVSVAGAIFMSEIMRQRNFKNPSKSLDKMT